MILTDRLAQVVCCLSLWALCLHTMEERRLGAALHMEAKFLEQLPVVELGPNIVQVTEAFRSLAIEPEIHGFVRALAPSVLVR